MRTTLILIALLLSVPAWAQKAPCLLQDYDKDKEPRYDCPGPEEGVLVRPGQHKKSVAIKLGARAPWRGILLDKGRVIDLGLKIESLRYLRWRDRKDARLKLETEIKYGAAMSRARGDLFKVQVGDLKGQNQAQRARIAQLASWYRGPVLWFVVGVVVTAGGAAAIIASTR